MHLADLNDQGYVVPTYRAPADACWFHFLHGNVPGHQIDFIYRAEVPRGALTQQHFSHLARIIKYLEPRAGAPFAFAIGNLSRDDTQHEPGHGGVALILAHRIKGEMDHAGRRAPPFSHGVAAIDRNMDGESLFAAAMAFCRHMLDEPSAADPRSLAPMYARFNAAGSSERVGVVEEYRKGFDDLPNIGPSRLSKKWICRGGPAVKRILIGHGEDASFEALMRVAARIAAMLYQSDIRWTSITTGRHPEIPSGVSVRFVPRREAVASDADTRALQIEQVPEEEAAIAEQLFGAVASDSPRWMVPLREWGLSARSALSEPPRSESMPEATAADVQRAPRGDGADAAVSVGEAVTAVRSPLALPEERAEEPREAAFDLHAFGAMNNAAPAEDVAFARGAPPLTDAALEVSSADREPRPMEDTAGAQGKVARDDRAAPLECTAALETPRRSGEEELEAGAPSARPRRWRQGAWVGVLAACAVGLLGASVLFERLTMSEHEAGAIADPPRALLGSATLTLARLVRDTAVEGKSAAGSGKGKGPYMALFPVKLTTVKPEAGSVNKPTGSQRQASSSWRRSEHRKRAAPQSTNGEDPPFDLSDE